MFFLESITLLSLIKPWTNLRSLNALYVILTLVSILSFRFFYISNVSKIFSRFGFKIYFLNLLKLNSLFLKTLTDNWEPVWYLFSVLIFVLLLILVIMVRHGHLNTMLIYGEICQFAIYYNFFLISFLHSENFWVLCNSVRFDFFFLIFKNNF